MKNLSDIYIYVRAFIYYINHYFTFVKLHTDIIIPTDQITTKIINI